MQDKFFLRVLVFPLLNPVRLTHAYTTWTTSNTTHKGTFSDPLVLTALYENAYEYYGISAQNKNCGTRDITVASERL
jgi:hypothetical protein